MNGEQVRNSEQARARSAAGAGVPRQVGSAAPDDAARLTHVDDTGAARMVDVSAKPATAREARAVATVRCSAEVARLLRAGELAKGDAVAVARIAGIQGAKRTSELIPLCHPIALTGVSLDICVGDQDVSISATARTNGPTGVEMEALTAASVAALALYDMIKAVDRSAVIEGVRVVAKTGGKSGPWAAGPDGHLVAVRPAGEPASARPDRPDLLGPDARRGAPEPTGTLSGRGAVITVSDRCARGEREDRTGPLIHDALAAWGLDPVSRAGVPDDVSAIGDAIRTALDAGARLVVTTGGTGIGPRDVTPEATAPFVQRDLPGLADALRSAPGAPPAAALSRGIAAMAGDALVVNLPGSLGGVRDGLAVLSRLVGHALDQAAGGDHPAPEPQARPEAATCEEAVPEAATGGEGTHGAARRVAADDAKGGAR